MAYIPVVSISRSQNVRLGRGSGGTSLVAGAVPSYMPAGDLSINPDTGALFCAFYANLNDSFVRRDLQRHLTLGSVLTVGALDATHTSDLFTPSAPTASAGTGLTVSVTAFNLKSRTFGGELSVAAVNSLTVQPNVSGSTRTDAVVVNNAGQVVVVTGAPNEAGASEVDTVTITGTPTGGTFTLSGTYDGNPFTTAALPYNATAAVVATAVQEAANLPSTVVGSGGPLPGSVVTLTTPGVTFSGLSGSATNLTGGTPVLAFAQTTAGVLAMPAVGGNVQVIATFTVTNGASSISGVNSVIPTS